MALRSRSAFEPETRRTAYVKGDATPPPTCRRRASACWRWRSDGLARSVPGLAEDANVSPRRGARADRGGRAGRRPTCRNSRPSRGPIRISPRRELSADQAQRRRRRCAQAVAAERFSASLLDGVTGSGKTEVYFEAVAEALRARASRC